MALCQQICSLQKQLMISYGNSNAPIPVKFSSPSHPHYSIETKSNFLTHGSVEQEITFIHKTYTTNQYNYPWLKIKSYRIKHYANSNYIILLHIHNLNNSNISQDNLFQSLYPFTANDSMDSYQTPVYKHSGGNNSKNMVILYSHGANDDLGTLFGFLLDLSTQTGIDVISYDYLGVGCSSGNQNANNLFTDIARVVDFMVSSLCYPLSSIMLMGENIGCISVTHLITDQKYSKIPFIVLISPCLTEELIDKANHIESTVLLIQGNKDPNYIVQTIKRYESKINKFWSWYPKKANRYNLLTQYRHKFYLKIKAFVDSGKGKNMFSRFDDSENSITQDDISMDDAKKVKRVKAIKNYVHTDESLKNKGNNLNSNQMPSVKIFVIEQSPSPKFSQKHSMDSGGIKGSITDQEDIKYDEGEDDNIFSLKQDSYSNQETVN